MMVHDYSVRERDRVFQILEIYGFEADFRRKDWWGSLNWRRLQWENFFAS